MEANKTQVTEFVLIGLTVLPGLQVPLFLLFLVIYLITMVGNLGLIFLIWKDPHLHTPMYLFLGSLAFTDACSSSSVTPKMLINFLSKNHVISLVECITQFYIFASSANTECFLLVVMAYDRYVAICNPLLYPVVMSKIFCIQLLGVSYIIGFLHPMMHIGLLFRLTFCKSNVIHYFYCEILQLFKISCTDPGATQNEDMEKENATLLTEFILTGLIYQRKWQIPLFLMFSVIYLITIVGNLGLIALIWNDPQLHIPMYLFLGSLAFVDAWISSTVTPKMLVNFLAKSKMISLPECIMQFFSFVFSATTECFLLAAMAYDRYVAICKPLLYPVIMTNRLCIRLLVSSFVGGVLHAFIHTGILFRLTFCNSNIIYHFYCDIIPLFKISCIDPSFNVLMVFIFSGSIQVFTILTVLVSYTLVLQMSARTKSLQGIKKAFSTCEAHLLSVSLYYGALLFMYVRPGSTQADDQDMRDSLFYTIIIPLLNPIIYSLRNRKVIDSLAKMLKRYV
ncbi:Olfactory receptor 5H2 [Pteropus alecto]|uniref:Olfactory receptor 5H2 n=2 Tax=Pteropus alecto TaxID=9402 RepID=L5L8D8_PTEAL|nr:Olfactory receptor 5H2 [Pteropus alecto]